MNGPREFILASASPRRRHLLEGAGARFRVQPSHLEEVRLEGESPSDYATRTAQEKALWVAWRHPGVWVLGADTDVILGPWNLPQGRILGKPGNSGEAIEMLSVLSGRSHWVLTAVAWVRASKTVPYPEVPKGLVLPVECRGFSVVTEVVFRALDREEIRGYAETEEPLDKAGAYAIQGGAQGFVAEIRGSLTNVIGLPLEEVLRSLSNLEDGPEES